MEFCFEVNPDLDLAIGMELSGQIAADDLYDDETVVDDVRPLDPTGAKPGSETKVQMLAARYAAGVPLWHDEDCYDHGPAGTALLDEDEELLEESETEEF
jgi:hypothetical protein